jgi:hypothetical protein
MGEAKLRKRLAEKYGGKIADQDYRHKEETMKQRAVGDTRPEASTRPEETIRKEQQKLWDRVWWNRHMALGEPEAGRDAARALEDKYGKGFLIPKSEIDWGMCLGQMMALAWVLGAEWEEAGDT